MCTEFAERWHGHKHYVGCGFKSVITSLRAVVHSRYTLLSKTDLLWPSFCKYKTLKWLTEWASNWVLNQFSVIWRRSPQSACMCKVATCFVTELLRPFRCCISCTTYWRRVSRIPVLNPFASQKSFIEMTSSYILYIWWQCTISMRSST